MKSADKRKLQILTDVLMMLLLLLQMSYSIAGELLHEISGIAFFVLFIVHHLLVMRYTQALFKGRATPDKLLKIVIDVLLLIIVILMMLSALPVSKHLFTFLPLSGLASAGRTVHMLGAYWGFALMSLHLGFHLDMMLHKPIKRNKTAVIAVLTLVFIAGLYFFVSEGIYQYMLMINPFVNFDAPLALFLLKYALISGMFAVLGYAVMSLLKRRKHHEIG